MLKHCLERHAKPFELGFGEPARLPPRPDSGAIEAFIGIDVSHPGKQRLIEQRRLDGQAPPAKQLRKLPLSIVSGSAWASESRLRPRSRNSSRPNRRGPQNGFTAACEGQARVGVVARPELLGVVTSRRPVMPRCTIH